MKGITKVGEVNFGKFRTEFFVTPKVKKYVENEKISLACLIPDAWRFYEASLFDYTLENGEYDKKFGTKFIVVYNKITESQGWSEEKGLEIAGFEEKFKFKKDSYILNSGTKLISVKNPKKEFIANYLVVKK